MLSDSGNYSIFNLGVLIYSGESKDLDVRISRHKQIVRLYGHLASGTKPKVKLEESNLSFETYNLGADKQSRLKCELEIHKTNDGLLSSPTLGTGNGTGPNHMRNVNPVGFAERISDGWANRTNEEKLRTSKLKSEGCNGMFIGMWHTPNGSFHSSHKAGEVNGISFTKVQKWCKNPEVVIRAYGDTIPMDWVGKTRRQVGFWFESKI